MVIIAFVAVNFRKGNHCFTISRQFALNDSSSFGPVQIKKTHWHFWVGDFFLNMFICLNLTNMNDFFLFVLFLLHPPDIFQPPVCDPCVRLQENWIWAKLPCDCERLEKLKARKMPARSFLPSSFARVCTALERNVGQRLKLVARFIQNCFWSYCDTFVCWGQLS